MRLFALILALGACTKAPQAPIRGAEVKQVLAERERRLRSFVFSAESTEQGQQARYQFAFRSPNLSRGHMLAPEDIELAFDGHVLRQQKGSSSPVEVVPLPDGASERALALAQTFMPFAPEGFRTPLLPLSRVSVSPVTHPLSQRAVQVTVPTEGGTVVDYILRWPTGDFLEKITRSASQVKSLRVTAEHCDAALQLCVPQTVVETLDGQELGTTRIFDIQLNSTVPQDFFSLPSTQ